MSDADWQIIDALYKTLHRQGRAIEELESRCTELERRLREHETEDSRSTLRVVKPEELEGAHVRA